MSNDDKIEQGLTSLAFIEAVKVVLTIGGLKHWLEHQSDGDNVGFVVRPLEKAFWVEEYHAEESVIARYLNKMVPGHGIWAEGDEVGYCIQGQYGYFTLGSQWVGEFHEKISKTVGKHGTQPVTKEQALQVLQTFWEPQVSGGGH